MFKNLFKKKLGGRINSEWNKKKSGKDSYLESSDDVLALLLKGANKYFNFNDVIGSEGIGFRDNGGTIEYKNDSGEWTSLALIESGSFKLDNLLFIKPNETEITGVQYQTISAAMTYAGNQNLSATNQYAIILPSGEIDENIEIQNYIHIVGQNGTVLSGEVDSKSTVYARYSGIYNCQITDLKGLADKQMNLYNCVISGFNASLAGNLFANNCHFIASGGSDIDLTGLSWLETYNCIFDNATTEKFVLGDAQISGGVANNDFNISGSAEINFIRGASANVLDGGSLYTTSCMLEVTVEAGGDWFNNNTLYDNRTSGLTAETIQDAIDELKGMIDALA